VLWFVCSQNVFDRLTAWLRSKGVSAQKPIHELRKESGSMVNRKHGLTAAKDFLRHADIAITAAHYIDRPRQATSGLGALLKATQDEKIISLEQEPLSGINRHSKQVARCADDSRWSGEILQD
jgi:hypothetical protein